MRLILTLVTILFFSLNAIAKVQRPQIIEIDTIPLEKTLPPLQGSEPSPVIENKTAILYKMKENIIRRELSFTPKKKYMKWV
ncbi:hypothetical protein SAMN05421636_11192 [Pricia antarctica]|uniref:Uncharacterized protein n=1 Tax=Pricia antarctica TaxID=641691 RepID=A0A1G7ICF4_9FLAO|nr:hypothetical protein [Pricia antarctica]SDF10258.1 hypothetical protein SAMN05421636_11192 [Pricia antarctica]